MSLVSVRPEIRETTVDRVEDALVDVYGLDEDRVEVLPFGEAVDRLVDEVLREADDN